MIRVLHVVNAADHGGAETMAMNLYRNIDRHEIQFDFTNHAGRPAAYDEEIKALGGRIWQLPKFNGLNYSSYVKAWRALLKDHPEYQIVHVHNYNIAGIVTRVARQMGVKVRITHSHSTRLNLPWYKRLGFYLLHGSMMRNSTHLFSCGTNAGRFLFGNRDFTLIPNALDTDLFRFNSEIRRSLRNKLGVDRSTKIYGHVGSFRTPKNHQFLIKVFSEIHRRNADTRLVLIGSGELLESAQSSVSELGLKDSVYFLGQQNNVNQWLSAFDIFLMPSLWEGLPVSVIEAQCAGLPCVISDVIDHDVNITGLVDFISLKKSSAEWAMEIEKIKSADRKAMGAKVAASPYNIANTVEQLTKFYKESL